MHRARQPSYASATTFADRIRTGTKV